MYVMGIWENAYIWNQGGMGNNEDIVYNNLTSGNLGWIGSWRSNIRSISGVGYRWDYITVSDKIKM